MSSDGPVYSVLDHKYPEGEPPTNVVGTPSSQQVAVTWTAPTSNGGHNITGYYIEWSHADLYVGSDYVNGLTTSYTATGLTNGTSYEFRVRAIFGNSADPPASRPFGNSSNYSSPVTPN